MSQPNCQASDKQSTHYDVVIVGGGLVGTIAAIALARLQLSVALIEAKPAQNNQGNNNQNQGKNNQENDNQKKINQDQISSFDQRSVALSASSVAILQSLNLWQALESIANPIEQILVSEQQGFGFTRLDAKKFSQSALGQVIPLTSTGPILWQAVEQEHNIDCYSPATVEEVQNEDAAWRVLINDLNSTETKWLKARLLIGADGSQSKITQLVNIETKQSAYQQSAIIANIETECEHKNRAYERFTPHGPLALLPLKNLADNSSDDSYDNSFGNSSNSRFTSTGSFSFTKPNQQKHNQLSLVWCHQADQASHLQQLDDQAFCQSLQKAFGYRLGKIQAVSERIVYPLSLSQAKQSFKQNLLLLGNAARTLHPIAGQGFNLGLRDIAHLVELLELQLETKPNKEFDVEALLQSFKQQCQSDWQQTTLATDGLISIFSNDFFVLKWARNKAMSLLNKLPYLKHQLGNAAMGYAGRSSKLARGFELQRDQQASPTLSSTENSTDVSNKAK